MSCGEFNPQILEHSVMVHYKKGYMKAKTSVVTLRWLSLLLGFGTFFSGCVKSYVAPSVAANYTVLNLIQGADNLTVYDSAIKKSGEASLLSGSGPFTCFVATDVEMSNVGITDSVINLLPDSVLTRWILYSTLPVGLTSLQLPTGPDGPERTETGDSVFFTSNGTGIFINGIQLISLDAEANNGIVDALASPLFPPTGNILQTAQADTNYSYFAAAVARTVSGQTNISNLLSSTNIYTVFIPDNDAFRNAGYTSITDINNSDPDSLSRLLEYHIIPLRVFTCDFLYDGIEQTLLTNFEVGLGVVGSAFGVRGTGNTASALLISPNIMAYNGVIHVINQVLLP
jgi:uncharacterized surface protein with fasciclin (FAS1) repeats